MKNIYLIRHGETEYNQKGIVQGRGINVGLNENGSAQADSFHRHYNTVPFDKVYTSTLLRTQQSVKKFTEHIPTETYSYLDEISWGKFEGQAMNPQQKKEMKNLIWSWNQGKTDVAPLEGESPEQVAARQRLFVPFLTDRSEEKNVLVCGHGRAIRIFLCVLMGLPIIEMKRFGHRNLCLYILTYAKDRFQITKENNIDHLTF